MAAIWRPLVVLALLGGLHLSWVATPVLARRAITVTEVVTDGITTNGVSYTSTDTFTLAADEIAICFIHNADADDAEAVSAVTHAAGAETFTEITSVTYNADDSRVSAW